MDFKKIIDLLLSANLDNNQIQELINEASQMDLSNEENQRLLIQKGSRIAGKSISKETEDKIVALIKEKGISDDLFKSF